MQHATKRSFKLFAMLVVVVLTIAAVVLAMWWPRTVRAQSNEALAEGQIFVATADVPGAAFPRVSAKAVIDAPPSVVWRVVSSCENSDSTMPNVSKSYVVRREKGGVVCSETISLPFPLGNQLSVTRWRLSSRGDTHKRTWSLVEGDFDYANGSITLSPFGTDGRRTLFVYENHLGPQLKVPDWLSRHFLERGLPDIVEHVRAASTRELEASQ